MHTRTSICLCLTLAAAAAPAAGQVREPALRDYQFVSQAGYASALWVNPAASGFARATRLVGHAAWGREGRASWSLRQYMVGLQSNLLSFGYRHDEFDEDVGPRVSDVYTVALGLAWGRSGLGAARTWRTGSDTEDSWEIGWLHLGDRVTAGLVWRDLGSPRVRETTVRERLSGAVSLTPGSSRFRFTAQADYATDGDGLQGFRLGANFGLVRFQFGLLRQLNALAVSEWDGDGNFEGVFFGVVARQESATAVGVAGLDSRGNFNAANVGLGLDGPRRRF